jgi:hypothetical protein
MKTKKFMLILIIFIIVISACSSETGKLTFVANGEGFVKDGFIDKGSWDISFENVYVNLSNIEAYSDKNSVSIKDSYFIDLKEVGEVVTKSVNVDNYQGLKFSLEKAKKGEYKGYTIVMTGKAIKENETIDFEIKLDEEISWDCPDGYVGDEIKGIVKKDKPGEVEMTFHFDHIFGDIEADVDDHINTGSVGFDYFLPFAKNGKLVVEQNTLKNKTDENTYNKFLESLKTLGHVGEGHCKVIK